MNDAIQMEIWLYVWRENYAQTIVQFADDELTFGIIDSSIQSKPYSFENLHDHFEYLSNKSSYSNNRSSSSRMTTSVNNQRCTVL